ncbi:MAG: hypothetical protein P9M14_16495 [Candidatus Alcyoniella australis]|nr:hypothetical protein [Candidatus Alcyoniella australis]
MRTYVLFPQTLTHDQLGPTAMQAALGQASKFDAGWVELRALAAESCIGKGSQVARVLFSNDGKGAIPAYSAPTWEIEIVPEGCWPWSVEEIAAANYRCKTQGMDSKFRDQNGLLQDEAWRAQMRKDLGISNTEWYRRADKAMSCVTSETFQP